MSPEVIRYEIAQTDNIVPSRTWFCLRSTSGGKTRTLNIVEKKIHGKANENEFNLQETFMQ